MDRPPRGRGLAAVAAALAALVPTASAVADPAPSTPTGAPTPGTLGSAVTTGGSEVLIVHTSGGAKILRAALSHAGAQVSVRHDFAALHAFSVQVPVADATRQIARLEALPGVTSVEKPVLRQFTGAATNDPSLPNQAYLNAVQAPAAWQQQHSSAAVKIAVVDSGIDVNHPDLDAKIAGTYNAVSPGALVTDKVGHGTFVAGVAAAETNNGVGVAGAGYDADILAVKIASSDGTIAIDDEVAGIRWAADHGADIINLSLGGSDFSGAEHSAVKYAQSKGVLVVAAAGNDATSQRQYPASYPGVVAVGAVDTSAHTRAPFSNYGPWVTLAAPGVGIYSTTPLAGSDFFPNTNGYSLGDGTSFSTPLVAGEAALLRAQNPTLSASRLRAALVASAHGYSGHHLGAGLVDFGRGLAHIAPFTTPTALTPHGTKNRIHVTASSTAKKVAFRIDAGPYSAPVSVVHGQADATISSWGYTDGQHLLSAVDCTSYGECNTAAATAALPIADDAPALTSPTPGHVVTGRFTVDATHPGGGALRLLIDGRARGFGKSAPYSFPYSASDLSDGSHDLRVQLCSLDGRLCAGPESTPVNVTTSALHPRISSLYPSTISPNGDGAHDAATLRFALPDTESVRPTVTDAHGRVVRSVALGTLHSGAHSWVWHGRRSTGSRLPDGSYTVALSTSRGALRGWVSRPATLDTSAPQMTHPSGADTRFYPVKDGYRDTFTTRTTLSGTGTLTLTIHTATGRFVRSVTGERHAGPAAITWNGRDRHGRRVAAGRYAWRLTVTDRAGNHRQTGSYLAQVSDRRLVSETVSITRHGDEYDSAGGTSGCAHASRSASQFVGGVRLTNGCPSNGFELAFAEYTFTVPHAIRYTKIKIRTYGRSVQRPSEITAAFQRNDGGIEVPRYQKVASSGSTWYTIAAVRADGHLTSFGHVHVNLILDSFYPASNDFDIGYARLRVGLVVLK